MTPKSKLRMFRIPEFMVSTIAENIWMFLANNLICLTFTSSSPVGTVAAFFVPVLSPRCPCQTWWSRTTRGLWSFLDNHGEQIAMTLVGNSTDLVQGMIK